MPPRPSSIFARLSRGFSLADALSPSPARAFRRPRTAGVEASNVCRNRGGSSSPPRSRADFSRAMGRVSKAGCRSSTKRRPRIRKNLSRGFGPVADLSELLALVQSEIPPRASIVTAVGNSDTPIRAGVGSTAKSSHADRYNTSRCATSRLCCFCASKRRRRSGPCPARAFRDRRNRLCASRLESAEGGALSAGLYEPYAVQSIAIEGAKPHPTTLVQSAAMASVAPPKPVYRPHLPKSVIESGLPFGRAA